MCVALLADAHLGGPGGGPEPLVEQLLALPRVGVERLVILGDLFHVWVAHRRFETPLVAQVLDAVDELRCQGIEVDYVEGNRDFFVIGGDYEANFDVVDLEVEFEVGGARVLAAFAAA